MGTQRQWRPNEPGILLLGVWMKILGVLIIAASASNVKLPAAEDVLHNFGPGFDRSVIHTRSPAAKMVHWNLRLPVESEFSDLVRQTIHQWVEGAEQAAQQDADPLLDLQT